MEVQEFILGYLNLDLFGPGWYLHVTCTMPLPDSKDWDFQQFLEGNFIQFKFQQKKILPLIILKPQDESFNKERWSLYI